METLESILIGRADRGMERLLPFLPEDACLAASREILSWKPGEVLLTAGFYVKGHPETDGPGGAFCLAFGLSLLGFSPLLLTDAAFLPVFRPLREHLPSLSLLPMEEDDPAGFALRLLAEHPFSGMISVERCSRTKDGSYRNCRGVSIDAHTAPCDLPFLLAPERGIPTIGVGDGGNEIGMGNLAEQIRELLSIEPAEVRTTRLVVADVSNWGAYGIAAGLNALTGKNLMPDPSLLLQVMEECVGLGAVDGFSGLPEKKVDGFPYETGLSVYRELQDWASRFSLTSER